MRNSKTKLPTMYDVARLAGVSQPTVSRVLNHNETSVQISDETRQRVLEAVEKLGYRPNVLARGLRTQRTQTIALLIADLSNSFYHPIARAVQDVARQHDYEVFIANSDHLYQNEKHFCEIVSRRSVDGIIMVPIHLTSEDLSVFYQNTNVPITVLGTHIEHPNIDAVFVDGEQAMYEATAWMIAECGHRRMGYVGVPLNLPPGPGRLRGFQRAMTEAGLSIEPRFMHEGDFTLESGRRVAYELVQRGELPSGLMVANDLMAIGIILALEEVGVSVPDDIAIVGFDDIPEASIVRPALTTIAQDPRDIGQKLADALFERIENPNITERRIFESHCRFVRRQSA